MATGQARVRLSPLFAHHAQRRGGHRGRVNEQLPIPTVGPGAFAEAAADKVDSVAVVDHMQFLLVLSPLTLSVVVAVLIAVVFHGDPVLVERDIAGRPVADLDHCGGHFV